MSIKLYDVFQKYPTATQPLFKNFSAEFENGKTHVILGASGSGKTTLLNIIARLCDYEGTVERGTASYVFQESRLIENITVKQNLQLVLYGIEKDKKKISRLADEYLRLTEIDEYANLYPDKLSGGEKQRLAIARAFIYPSDALLMDEPFNSLDYGVKSRIIKQLSALLDRYNRTTLFVTHDADEALLLADEIYLLRGKPAALEKVASVDEKSSNRDVYSQKFNDLRKKIVGLLTEI